MIITVIVMVDFLQNDAKTLQSKIKLPCVIVR